MSAPVGFPPVRRVGLATLQVNLGYLCNQSCVHCHVSAGPLRPEVMRRETVEEVLRVAEELEVTTLDLTGGAPELNPHFRHLVERARRLGIEVIDRCNLTVLEEPGLEDLAGFLAAQRVEIVASLPCYLEQNVDAQRGRGVFDKSLRALRRLNALGYGREGSGLELTLVFNPQGPSLPPPQQELEAAYREHLRERYGIVFNRLFTMVNMPIQRFARTLESGGRLLGYLELLRSAHREENLPRVMCRTLVSVDWRGDLYDCDFNQMLGVPLRLNGQPRCRVADLIGAELEGCPVAVAGHCFGCTAGQGSSCGGALETS